MLGRCTSILSYIEAMLDDFMLALSNLGAMLSLFGPMVKNLGIISGSPWTMLDYLMLMLGHLGAVLNHLRSRLALYFGYRWVMLVY